MTSLGCLAVLQHCLRLSAGLSVGMENRMAAAQRGRRILNSCSGPTVK